MTRDTTRNTTRNTTRIDEGREGRRGPTRIDDHTLSRRQDDTTTDERPTDRPTTDCRLEATDYRVPTTDTAAEWRRRPPAATTDSKRAGGPRCTSAALPPRFVVDVVMRPLRPWIVWRAPPHAAGSEQVEPPLAVMAPGCMGGSRTSALRATWPFPPPPRLCQSARPPIKMIRLHARVPRHLHPLRIHEVEQRPLNLLELLDQLPQKDQRHRLGKDQARALPARARQRGNGWGLRGSRVADLAQRLASNTTFFLGRRGDDAGGAEEGEREGERGRRTE